MKKKMTFLLAIAITLYSQSFAQTWWDVNGTTTNNVGEFLGTLTGSVEPNVIIKTNEIDHSQFEDDGTFSVNSSDPDYYSRININMGGINPTPSSRLNIKQSWNDYLRLYNSTGTKYWSLHNPQGEDELVIGRHPNPNNPLVNYPFSFTEDKGLKINQKWGDWLQFHRTADNGFFALHNPQNQNAMSFYYMDEWNNPTWGLLSMYNSGLVTIGHAPTTTSNNVSLHYGDYSLLVEKGIMAARVKVALPNTSFWSDYVFADDYELMPLSDVEEYVRKNKHLPNIPSAEKVVEEGLDLGKMDSKLLEKIEELTLYMIDQQKTISKLESQVEELQKTIR